MGLITEWAKMGEIYRYKDDLHESSISHVIIQAHFMCNVIFVTWSYCIIPRSLKYALPRCVAGIYLAFAFVPLVI